MNRNHSGIPGAFILISFAFSALTPAALAVAGIEAQLGPEPRAAAARIALVAIGFVLGWGGRMQRDLPSSAAVMIAALTMLPGAWPLLIPEGTWLLVPRADVVHRIDVYPLAGACAICGAVFNFVASLVGALLGALSKLEESQP